MMSNLPFCWQQNVFSSLQSKSTFSYLFSFALIQKQFSVISWGLICNQRDGFFNSWVFHLSLRNHYFQTQCPIAASRCLGSNPCNIFPQSVCNKIQVPQEAKVLLKKKQFRLSESWGFEAEWNKTCFFLIIPLKVFLKKACVHRYSSSAGYVTHHFARLCDHETIFLQDSGFLCPNYQLQTMSVNFSHGYQHR